MSALMNQIVGLHSLNKDACDVCYMSKQHRQSFPTSSIQINAPFELIHCDLWRPYTVVTAESLSFFPTIVDDYIRCTWVYLLKSKSETTIILHVFHQMVMTQFDERNKVLRSDQGTEFYLHEFFYTTGMIHETSCAETPQHNHIILKKSTFVACS